MAVVGMVAIVLVVIFFGDILLNPNDRFFTLVGDGIKAYFATAYYVKYDAGLHFSGMNYPFGEHINYPDLQPILGGALQVLKWLGLPVADYVVGATNLAALLGVVLTPMVLYAILRRTRLPVWYAALMAIVIGFLAPQLWRLGGHMSLSYSCFVPFFWYCLIRIQESPFRPRWYVALGISGLLTGGTSVYFLACASFFALAHAVVLAWQLRLPWPVVWRLAVTAILPLLIFRSWLWLTDPVTDRPQNPYGFLEYVASPVTVFTPVLEPVSTLWQKLFHTEPQGTEGWAYVGLVAAAVAVATFGRVISHLRRRRWQRVLRPALPMHLRSGLWAAGFLLLLAFGWPFKFTGLEWLSDYAGPLKQFRALGRFAWPFYFVFSTYAAYYLFRVWRYLRQHRAARFATSWLTVLLVLWGGEAFLQAHAKSKEVAGHIGAIDFMSAENNVAYQQLSWSGRQAADFQAILPLPYFAIGTDKTDISGSSNSIWEAFRFALASGLPLVSSQMTRSSVGQTLQNLQLLSSPLVKKKVDSYFPSSKPLLLLVTNDALLPAEQRLVTLGRKLVATPQLTLYELPIAALQANALAQELAVATALLPTLPVRPGGIQATTPAGVILQSYDDAPERRGRLGAGASYKIDYGFTTLYDGALPAPADTGRYEAAVWMYGKSAYGYENMHVRLYDATGLVGEEVADGRKAMEVQGDWVRVVVPFHVRPGITRIEALYQNRDLLVDDLLIRPINTDVYYYVGTGNRRRLVKNTYPLTP
jgi:hypothetical protein